MGIRVVFYIARHEFRTIYTSVDKFEDALLHITPPSLRHCGLPLLAGELHDSAFVQRQIYG